MTKDEMQQLKDKYFAEYGDAGMKFMSFVIEQNMQIDLVKAGLGAALDRNEDMTNEFFKAFGKVHAHLTGSMAQALELSDDIANHIFDSATQAYELIRQKSDAGETKTND